MTHNGFAVRERASTGGLKFCILADMAILYSILLFLAFFLYLPIYFVRLRIFRKEKLHLFDRMGFGLEKKETQKPSLWIHAVSVGEVLSLRNLIREMKKQHPEWIIYLSTLTNSGYRMAREKLPDIDRLFFVPIDFTLIAKKYFRAYRPSLFILAESEFWPNLIRTAHSFTQGVLLINGRISDRSYRRFSRLAFFIRWMIQPIHCFIMQTMQDKQRLQYIGIDPRRILVAGNLKAEIELPDMTAAMIRKQKEWLHIRTSERVVLAGSTHKGEDTFLLEIFSRIISDHPELRLILAPRHPDRVAELESTARKLGVQCVRRTQVDTHPDWQVLFLDTFGELGRMYAVCDNAFIGGSLVPHGGQNLLEPAFYGKPIHFGPYMNNFAHLADLFTASGAARIVKSEADCEEIFLAGDSSLKSRGKTSRRVLDSLQGATQVTLKIIEKYMNRDSE